MRGLEWPRDGEGGTGQGLVGSSDGILDLTGGSLGGSGDTDEAATTAALAVASGQPGSRRHESPGWPGVRRKAPRRHRPEGPRTREERSGVEHQQSPVGTPWSASTRAGWALPRTGPPRSAWAFLTRSESSRFWSIPEETLQSLSAHVQPLPHPKPLAASCVGCGKLPQWQRPHSSRGDKTGGPARILRSWWCFREDHRWPSVWARVPSVAGPRGGGQRHPETPLAAWAATPE